MATFLRAHFWLISFLMIEFAKVKKKGEEMKYYKHIILIVCLIFISNCTYHVGVNPNLTPSTTIGKKLHLNVGVYIPPDIKRNAIGCRHWNSRYRTRKICNANFMLRYGLCHNGKINEYERDIILFSVMLVPKGELKNRLF